MKTIFVTILFCVLMVGCTSKPGQNPAVDSINNSVGIMIHLDCLYIPNIRSILPRRNR